MGSKSPQSHAKRARELAVKEKRDRKRAKKAERAAAAPDPEPVGEEAGQNDEQVLGEGE